MKKILKALGHTLLPVLINLLIRTLKIKIHELPDKDKNFVFIFFHSQMIIGWWLFRDRRSAALVSASEDGDILNRLLVKWRYNVVRGSSSKGGKDALKELIEIVNKNYSAVITPDGPRGPAGEIKNGALIVSNKCGIPVIPVKIVYHRKKVLTKSWDKFEIPLPFSGCDVYFGNEYHYEKYLGEKELSALKEIISKEM
ncbi:MAG TPA: lysophospholipid acyltransferase family protein [Ignavibacteria bacterium]|nr:lysophospholipid acyltransferase family protein [Ignavibacteria bacterium]